MTPEQIGRLIKLLLSSVVQNRSAQTFELASGIRHTAYQGLAMARQHPQQLQQHGPLLESLSAAQAALEANPDQLLELLQRARRYAENCLRKYPCQGGNALWRAALLPWLRNRLQNIGRSPHLCCWQNQRSSEHKLDRFSTQVHLALKPVLASQAVVKLGLEIAQDPSGPSPLAAGFDHHAGRMLQPQRSQQA